MAQEPLLTVDRVEKAFGGIHAVDHCSLSVLPRTITGLIGPNGAGKSTLFNIIAGLYRPDGGAIHFNGRRNDGPPPDDIFHPGRTQTWQIPPEVPNPSLLQKGLPP